MTQANKTELVRWGILGAATIAQKNWLAIKNSGNGFVVAVASRELNRAEDFIKRCQTEAPFAESPEAVQGYDALLKRDDIDAVYVPLPTGVRPDVVIAAANAGKHVVCEKPCAFSSADLKRMIDACEKSKVQFMDGVMFRHSKRMNAIRSYLDGENKTEGIGQLKRIYSQFSFNGGDDFKSLDIRLRSELEKYGCLGDLGWYTALFTLWVKDFEMPVQVSAQLLSSFQHPSSAQPVPTELSAEMKFADGVSAGFYCSFETELQQWANISGTAGHIAVSDFVLPFTGEQINFNVVRSNFDVNGCQFEMHDGIKKVPTDEHGHGHHSAQETNLFRNFAAIVIGGQLDTHWPNAAIKTQRIVDACYQSAFNQGATQTILR